MLHVRPSHTPISCIAPNVWMNACMHEIKCRKEWSYVTVTLGRVDPWLYLLPTDFKNDFKRWPFTLNLLPFLVSHIFTVPIGNHNPNNEWPCPSWFQLPWKKMKPRIIELYFLSGDKSFFYDKFIMKNLNLILCNLHIFISPVPHLLKFRNL